MALSNTCESGIITSRELRKAGVTARHAAKLCGPGGPWRRLMPGVILLRDSAPTRLQLLQAAVARFGPDVVVTGADALRARGVDCSVTREVHLLVPDYRRVLGEPGMLPRRTTRMPPPTLIDGVPFAPPARAALDLARLELDPVRIDELISLPLYWGLCTLEELSEELDAGNRRGSAAVRAALRRVDPEETYACGLAKQALDGCPLPSPSWNVTICDRRGRPIGAADAWWDDIGLAWQFRTPKQGTANFHPLALTATGTVLVRCTIDQLRKVPREVAAELVRGYAEAARTPRPKVRTIGQIDDAA
jgi:hypothetical protein